MPVCSKKFYYPMIRLTITVDLITTCRYVVGIAESVTFIYARMKNSRM